MSTSLALGFRDEGAIWKADKLYYFAARTGISYQPIADHPSMFRVVYPDGSLSVDYYNLTRVRQHCRDVAHSLYPRQASKSEPCSLSVWQEPRGDAVHSLKRKPGANPTWEERPRTPGRPASKRATPPIDQIGGVEMRGIEHFEEDSTMPATRMRIKCSGEAPKHGANHGHSGRTQTL
jgi:hypothetical protein